MSNSKMVVLALRSNAPKLRDAFFRYNDQFVKATGKEVPFLRKVELMRVAEAAKREIEETISHLHASGAAEVNMLSEEWFYGFESAKPNYSFMNGLYESTRLRERVDFDKEQLSEELLDYCHSQLQVMNSDEYVLFWNVGELEADGILQNKRS